MTMIQLREDMAMTSKKIALTPPMGWNSYDYYDTTVNEEQVRALARTCSSFTVVS